jgi:hypothetical protein
MIERKGSFYLGVFVFIIPFLGFPTMWKMFLVVFGGVLLILTSLKVPTPRKNLKPKFKKEDSFLETSVVINEPIKNIEPVIVSAPASAPVVDAPIIRIDRETKKPRKPKVKAISVKKLDIKY